MAPAAISPPGSPNPSAAQSSDLTAYRGYHHVHWYVGNAKQAAAFYVARSRQGPAPLHRTSFGTAKSRSC
jgi:hypothetical protein